MSQLLQFIPGIHMYLGIKIQMGHPIGHLRHILDRPGKPGRYEENKNTADHNAKNTNVGKKTTANICAGLNTFQGNSHGNQIVIIGKTKKIDSFLSAGLIFQLRNKISFFN